MGVVVGQFAELADRGLGVAVEGRQGGDGQVDGEGVRVGGIGVAVEFDVRPGGKVAEDLAWGEDAGRVGEALVVAAGLLAQFERLVQHRDRVRREQREERGGTGIGGLVIRPDEADREQGFARAERVGVDAVDGFDVIAEVVEADRRDGAGRRPAASVGEGRAAGEGVEVDDPAAGGEVAGLVDGVLPAVPRPVQPVEQPARRQRLAHPAASGPARPACPARAPPASTPGSAPPAPPPGPRTRPRPAVSPRPAVRRRGRGSPRPRPPAPPSPRTARPPRPAAPRDRRAHHPPRRGGPRRAAPSAAAPGR